jgi:hypothetical protein
MTVYWIQCGSDGPVKIGYGSDARARLRHIQTANWQECNLIAEVPDWGAAEEEMLHVRWAHRHIRGEWFNPHPDMLREAQRASSEYWTRAATAERAALNTLFAPTA